MGSSFSTYFTDFRVFLQWSLSSEGKILLLSSAWSAGSETYFLIPPMGLLVNTTRKQLLWQKHRILPKEQRNKTRLFKALMDARRFLSLDFPTNKSCGQNYLWGRRSAPDS